MGDKATGTDASFFSPVLRAEARQKIGGTDGELVGLILEEVCEEFRRIDEFNWFANNTADDPDPNAKSRLDDLLTAQRSRLVGINEAAKRINAMASALMPPHQLDASAAAGHVARVAEEIGKVLESWAVQASGPANFQQWRRPDEHWTASLDQKRVLSVADGLRFMTAPPAGGTARKPDKESNTERKYRLIREENDKLIKAGMADIGDRNKALLRKFGGSEKTLRRAIGGQR